MHRMELVDRKQIAERVGRTRQRVDQLSREAWWPASVAETGRRKLYPWPKVKRAWEGRYGPLPDEDPAPADPGPPPKEP